MAYVNAASLLPERKRIYINSATVIMSEKEKADVGNSDWRKVDFDLFYIKSTGSQTELQQSSSVKTSDTSWLTSGELSRSAQLCCVLMFLINRISHAAWVSFCKCVRHCYRKWYCFPACRNTLWPGRLLYLLFKLLCIAFGLFLGREFTVTGVGNRISSSSDQGYTRSPKPPER